MELTILMPCLNEAETLAICIRKAKQFLEENQVDGEILISDNGSTDGSREIAEREGARVTVTEARGYGSALINGTKEARGTYVIMGDADDSYDFLHLMPFLEKLREGYDLVMGDRFAGGIENGAMPWSHRYIGNPILSFVGRLFFIWTSGHTMTLYQRTGKWKTAGSTGLFGMRYTAPDSFQLRSNRNGFISRSMRR